MANRNIKEQIEYKGLVYIVYSMYHDELLPLESVSNITAYDKEGNLVWQIDPPTTKYDIYARMYFKDNHLFAVSNGGQLYEIDKDSGKIISSKMIK